MAKKSLAQKSIDVWVRNSKRQFQGLFALPVPQPVKMLRHQPDYSSTTQYIRLYSDGSMNKIANSYWIPGGYAAVAASKIGEAQTVLNLFMKIKRVEERGREAFRRQRKANAVAAEARERGVTVETADVGRL